MGGGHEPIQKGFEPGNEDSLIATLIQNRDAINKLSNAIAPLVRPGGLGDAPSDGSEYGRKNGAWEVITSSAGLSNLVEDLTPQLGGDLDLNGKNLDFPTTPNISDVLDEDDMVSDSATVLATQQSIKAYADTKLANIVEDLSPVLGADLDAGNFDITNITDLVADGTITLGAGGLVFPGADGSAGQAIITDGAGNLSFSGVVSASVDALILDMRKGSAGTITKGTPIYFSGWNASGYAEVEQADADDPNKMPAITIADQDITNGATVSVVVYGNMPGMVTNGFSVGDRLYVSDAGVLTATRPTNADDAVQALGTVLRSHASLGVIQITGAGRSNDQPNNHSDAIFRISDDGDLTKTIMFQASGITTGNVRTITMPDADVDLGALLADVVDDTTPQLGGALDGQGNDLNNMGVLFLSEQASAEADVAGKGQLWVKTATPNQLWFTDDAGTDVQLGVASGGGNPYGANTTVNSAGGADQTSLETAVTGASAGDIIFVEAGHSETISTTTAWTQSDLTIIGANMDDVTITFSNSSNKQISGPNMTVKNMKWARTGAGRIQINDTRFRARDMWFTSNQTATFQWQISGVDASIQDCIIESTASFAVDNFTVSGAESVVSNNHFQCATDSNSAGSGVFVFNFSTPNAVVSGNVFELTSNYGGAGSIVEVNGCSFVGNSIYSDDTTIVANFALVLGSSALASGNNFRNVSGAVDMASGAVFTGNRIQTADTDTANIIECATACVITGNYIVGETAGKTAIALDAGADNVAITGNVIRNCLVGVSIPGTTNDQNVVVGNSFSGCTTDISDSGTGTVKDHDPTATTTQVLNST